MASERNAKEISNNLENLDINQTSQFGPENPSTRTDQSIGASDVKKEKDPFVEYLNRRKQKNEIDFSGKGEIWECTGCSTRFHKKELLKHIPVCQGTDAITDQNVHKRKKDLLQDPKIAAVPSLQNIGQYILSNRNIKGIESEKEIVQKCRNLRIVPISCKQFRESRLSTRNTAIDHSSLNHFHSFESKSASAEISNNNTQWILDNIPPGPSNIVSVFEINDMKVKLSSSETENARLCVKEAPRKRRKKEEIAKCPGALTCDYCETTLTRKQNLRAHIEKFHPQHAPNIPNMLEAVDIDQNKQMMENGETLDAMGPHGRNVTIQRQHIENDQTAQEYTEIQSILPDTFTLESVDASNLFGFEL